jgi:hypothetical protein
LQRSALLETTLQWERTIPSTVPPVVILVVSREMMGSRRLCFHPPYYRANSGTICRSCRLWRTTDVKPRCPELFIPLLVYISRERDNRKRQVERMIKLPRPYRNSECCFALVREERLRLPNRHSNHEILRIMRFTSYRAPLANVFILKVRRDVCGLLKMVDQPSLASQIRGGRNWRAILRPQL